MADEESYAVEAKSVGDASLKKDVDQPLSADELEPFGNEDKAEVKYRTMQWW